MDGASKENVKRFLFMLNTVCARTRLARRMNRLSSVPITGAVTFESPLNVRRTRHYKYIFRVPSRNRDRGARHLPFKERERTV